MEQVNKVILLSARIAQLMVRMSEDQRVNVWHIAVMQALVCISYTNDAQNPVIITRKLVMRLSHVRSLSTYHKCIRQLQEYGYIKYTPSYNYYDKTKVVLNDEAGKAL